MSATIGPSRPVALPVVAENIPDALKALAHWVVWKYVPDLDRETGETSWDKPPVCAKNGGAGSSTNAATWTTFAEAYDFHSEGGYDGLGLVLHFAKTEAFRLVAIDLDDCRNPQTGVIDEWALAIIRLIDSYTEVSPSGRGVRIFLFGALPPFGRKKGPYENYESGRYVTVTGQRIDGTPATIEHRQEQLLAVHRQHFGDGVEPPAPRPNGAAPAVDLDTRELLERAFRSSRGPRIKALFDGDASGYASRSEADLALCNYLAFWFDRDADRIMSAILESGLFRSKWNREDYQRRTIGKAVAGCKETYSEWRHKAHQTKGAHKTNGAANHDGEGPGDQTTETLNGSDGVHEAVDDPHRLARLFLADYRRDGLGTLLSWREEWFVWDGAAWEALPVTELRGRLSQRIKTEFDAANREAVRRLKESAAVPTPGG